MPRIVYTAIPAAAVDFREFDVITPHPTAARALGAPHRTLQSLARSVAAAHGFQDAKPVNARRLLVLAVANVLRSDEVRGNDDGALATRLTLSLQTVMRSGIATPSLRQYGSDRVKQLAEVVDRYTALLRERQLVDDAEMLLFAADLALEPRRLYIHGYFRARPEEIKFISRVAGDGSIFVLPQYDDPMFQANARALEELRDKGWSVENPPTSTGRAGARLAARFRGEIALDEPGPEVSAGAHADIDKEVRAALGQVKLLLLEGVSPAELVLVARDPRQYGPAVAAVAAEYQIPVRRAYRISLAETTIGHWLALLLESAREGLPFETTLRMVAHPLGAGIAGEWRIARAKHVAGIDAWRLVAPALDALDWPDRSTRNSWIERFRACLAAFRVREALVNSSADLLALDLLEGELFDVFHGGATLNRAEFIDEVAGILALLSVPVEPGAGGVELHEPQSIIGARYEYLFILGAADGVLPGPAVDNSVVDFFERKQLAQQGVAFELAAEVARWEDLGFHFLLETGSRAVHLSYPKMSDGQARFPSAYFRRLGLGPETRAAAATVYSRPEWRRLALGKGPAADPVLTAAQTAWAVELGRETAAAYDQFDGATGLSGDAAGRVWSASQLLNLGQCPFRWFAGKILRLGPTDEPELGLAPNVRGTLYHRVLELALGQAPAGANLREWALSKLDAAFEQAEKEPEVGVPAMPAWPAQRLEHLEILRRAIASEGFLAPGATVTAMEQKFATTWNGLRVQGYIDRVDRTPNGLSFIDYKTGGQVPKGIQDESGRLKLDLQLPIYIEGAAPALYPAEPVAGGYYFSISKAKELLAVGPDAVPELKEFASTVVRRLATGDFPVAPDTNLEACTYCDFAPVCRKGHRLTRKSG